ncbi:hypothetical protein GW17_00045489, partial [Ensete ventricosum]
LAFLFHLGELMPHWTSYLHVCTFAHTYCCLLIFSPLLGRCLHACLTKTALTQHTLVANRLMDLYSRCGSLPCAKSTFSLASEGCRMLSLMEKEYGICPRAEHYGALIDTLGRKHQLKEAMQFIECLASGGDLASVGTWGALLGACRVHGNLEIANIAAESLLKLDPKNGARYTMLSNIYAAAGSWDDVRRVRLLMKEKGLKKGPGVRMTKQEVKQVKEQSCHPHIIKFQECSLLPPPPPSPNGTAAPPHCSTILVSSQGLR